jgi:class 3 adenylate cyclase
VAEAIGAVDEVVEVHDLHVWTITSGFPSLAAHVLVGPEADCHEARRQIERLLEERFEIDHTTLQVDHRQPPALIQIEGAERESSGADNGSSAFVFADIAGFTALAERGGDEHAAEIVDDFQRHVRELLARHGGEQIKAIGDAVMLRFPESRPAIELGLDLAHHVMRRPDHPAVRVGVHYGPAVERRGDWLGTTVNVAARVAALARADEVLVTRAALDAAGNLTSVSVGEIRQRQLRNVSAPVGVAVVSCSH